MHEESKADKNTNTQLMEQMRKQQEAFDTKMKERDDQLAALRQQLVNNGSPAGGGGRGVSGTSSSSSSSSTTQSSEDLRKQRYLVLFQNLQKCTKVKDYKMSSQENIREWLKRFDLYIQNLSKACDIDPAALTRDEYLNLIKSKLDLSVLTELQLKFTSKNTSWTDVTKVELHKYLIEQFGSKAPDLSSLLKYFGPNRPIKSPETKVKNFYCTWWENLPLAFKPNTNEEKDATISLLQRTLFYHALGDAYLQQKLSEIPEAEQTLQKFHEIAQHAEAQRDAYREAVEKGNVLDAASNVSVNKFDNSQSRGRGRGKFTGRGRGRGSGNVSGADAGHSGQQQHGATGNDGSGSKNQTNRQSKKKSYPCFHCQETGHTIYRCKKYEA